MAFKSLGRALHLCIPLLTLLTAPLASAQGPEPQTITAEFGFLYGMAHDDYPTTVISGTGELGKAMEGHKFFWVCLDFRVSEPDPLEIATFTVSQEISILSAGDFWGSTITDQASRDSIGNAISNMFFAYSAEIMADTSSTGHNNTYGSAFQMAVWYLTEGYNTEVWSGAIDEIVIANLLAWNGGSTTTIQKIADVPLIETLLQASLINSGGNQQIFFANPDDPDMQPIALLTDVAIPIPEPSSALLLGATGALIAFRRMRSR